LSFRSAAEESASALVSEIGPGFSPDTTHTRKSGLQPLAYALRSLHHKTQVPLHRSLTAMSGVFRFAQPPIGCHSRKHSRLSFTQAPSVAIHASTLVCHSRKHHRLPFTQALSFVIHASTLVCHSRSTIGCHSRKHHRLPFTQAPSVAIHASTLVCHSAAQRRNPLLLLFSEIGPGFSPDTTHTRRAGLQPLAYALRSLHHKTRVPFIAASPR
jgi:hypothetical protein